MNKQKLFTLIAAGLGAIATFLPWASVSMMGFSKSVSGTAGDGILTLILFIVIIVLALAGNLANMVTKIITALLSVGCLAIGIYDMGNLDKFGGIAETGIGLYLLIVASIAVIGIVFGMKAETKASE